MMRLLNRLIPFHFAALRPGSLSETGREGSQVGIIHGRTNMRFSYPETGGISQSQRAVGKPRNRHNWKTHRVWDRTRGSRLWGDCVSTAPLHAPRSSYLDILTYRFQKIPHNFIYKEIPNAKFLVNQKIEGEIKNEIWIICLEGLFWKIDDFFKSRTSITFDMTSKRI